MDEQERKQHIQNTFNTVAEGYDRDPLRFFKLAAANLPGIFRFQGNEQVLDVATGTGTPALALALQVPQGKVTGIDFSEGMLAQAKIKAAEKNLNNIEFQHMDMTAMSLPKQHFDAANCSFGIFFVEDMEGLTKHIASRLKPNGTFVTSHFLQGSFSPLADLFVERIETYGIEVPPLGWMRLGTETQNLELYEAAGFINIEMTTKNISYHFETADQWWDLVWYAGFRGLLSQLTETELIQFKHDHLNEVSALANDDGIKLNIEIIYTRGTTSNKQ